MKILEMLNELIRTAGERFSFNEWIYADEMMLYVRKGYHYLEDRKCTTLDLASFEVYRKGQGTFTRFIQSAHTLHPWDATYVECVHNSRLRIWLERQGFHRLPDSDPGNYYLWKNETIKFPIGGDC